MQKRKKKIFIVFYIMVMAATLMFQPTFAGEIGSTNAVTVINGNERTIAVDEGSTIILDEDLEIIELSEQNENSKPNTRYFKVQKRNHTFATIVWILILILLLVTLLFDLYGKDQKKTHKKTQKNNQRKKS